jgi:hypothetical protein
MDQRGETDDGDDFLNRQEIALLTGLKSTATNQISAKAQRWEPQLHLDEI